MSMAGALPPAPARAGPAPPRPEASLGGEGVECACATGRGRGLRARAGVLERGRMQGKDALEMRGYGLGRSWGRQVHREVL